MSGLQLILKSHFEGNFYGGRTVIGKIKFIQALRHIFEQFLAQLNGWLMSKINKNNVLQLVNLLFNGSVDFRIAVSLFIKPTAANNIYTY